MEDNLDLFLTKQKKRKIFVQEIGCNGGHTRLIPKAHISDRVPYEPTLPIRSGFSK